MTGDFLLAKWVKDSTIKFFSFNGIGAVPKLVLLWRAIKIFNLIHHNFLIKMTNPQLYH